MIARQHEADLRLLSPPLDPEKEREAEQLLPRYPEARSTSAGFAHPAAELLTNRVHAHALLAELADRGIRGTGRTRPARLLAAGQRSELRHSLVDNCRLIDNASFRWDIAGGCVMTDSKIQYDRGFLRLLQLGPFERRIGGGWRFGTKIISNVIAERLLASGLAEISGIHLRLKRSANTQESDPAAVNELNLQL